MASLLARTWKETRENIGWACESIRGSDCLALSKSIAPPIGLCASLFLLCSTITTPNATVCISFLIGITCGMTLHPFVISVSLADSDPANLVELMVTGLMAGSIFDLCLGLGYIIPACAITDLQVGIINAIAFSTGAYLTVFAVPVFLSTLCLLDQGLLFLFHAFKNNPADYANMG